MKKYVFGVDVGGTTVKMGLFNVAGEVLEKWEEEAARAKSESHFSMHFLRNFKSMIT